MSAQTAAESAGLSITVRRWYAAPRDNVFRAWTDPHVLKNWWCPAGWTPAAIEIDLRVAGSYRIGMRNLETGSCVSVCGGFIEVDAPKRLAYTWRWENAFDGMPETLVIVEFAESGRGTEVVLRHERLPAAKICVRHLNGWIDALARVDGAIRSYPQ